MNKENAKDLLNASIIDMKDKRRLTVKFLDEDGDEVDMEDVMKTIADYVDENMDTTHSKVVENTLPLMVHIIMSTIDRTIKRSPTAIYALVHDGIKEMMMKQMLYSYYLVQFVSKNKLKLHSEQEDVSEAEILKITRLTLISKALSMGNLYGIESSHAMATLLKDGHASKEELIELGIPEDAIDKAMEQADIKEDSTTSNN